MWTRLRPPQRNLLCAVTGPKPLTAKCASHSPNQEKLPTASQQLPMGSHHPALWEGAAYCSSSLKAASRLSELGTSLLERTTAPKCRLEPLLQWAPCYANERVFSASL